MWVKFISSLKILSVLLKTINSQRKSKFYFTKAIELIFTEIKKIGKRFGSPNDLAILILKFWRIYIITLL